MLLSVKNNNKNNNTIIISRYFNNRAEHIYIIYTVKPQKLRLGKRARDGTKRRNALTIGVVHEEMEWKYTDTCFLLFCPVLQTVSASVSVQYIFFRC